MTLTTLAIETSCDETSVAVIKDGREILSNIISTQIETHKIFGGVVPEVASRLHLDMMNPILQESVKEAGVSLADIDFISVTNRPGLIGSLIVGVSCAKALSFALDIPLVAVNHMNGHICANYLEHKDLKPPFIALVVSGGHTFLLEIKDYANFEVIGKTVDDAAGESFDKVARTLGLPYPGGPEIEKLALKGNENAIEFPKAFMEKDNYNFSFSGLKTSVLNYINSEKQRGNELNSADIAASFQKTVVDVLEEKAFSLVKTLGYDKLVMSGGVVSNGYFKNRMKERAEKENINLYYPSPVLCTDNAAMIGSAGYYDYINGKRAELDLKVYPQL